VVPPLFIQLCRTAPTCHSPGHGKPQDGKDLHRTTFNMTQCLLTPAADPFLIITGTQNVMYGKILLRISISIRCKVPALLTSIQPDKRRCSHNSLSDICWEVQHSQSRTSYLPANRNIFFYMQVVLRVSYFATTNTYNIFQHFKKCNRKELKLFRERRKKEWIFLDSTLQRPFIIESEVS